MKSCFFPNPTNKLNFSTFSSRFEHQKRDLVSSRSKKGGVPIIKMEIQDGICHEEGGGSRGGLKCHIPILKNDFFENHLESFPDCENVFCT